MNKNMMIVLLALVCVATSVAAWYYKGQAHEHEQRAILLLVQAEKNAELTSQAEQRAMKQAQLSEMAAAEAMHQRAIAEQELAKARKRK